MGKHTIAVIPGDGVGKEVVDEGIRVMETLSLLDANLAFAFVRFDWGSERYFRHGRMMPEDALETLATFDAIYLGAVGDPRLPDHVTLQGLLLPIRRAFDQYVNVRPAILYEGVESPLRGNIPISADGCTREASARSCCRGRCLPAGGPSALFAMPATSPVNAPPKHS